MPMEPDAVNVTVPATTDRAARAADAPAGASHVLDLLIVIVCYRAADLTIDCLRSLAPETRALSGVRVAVCENGTGGDSRQQIADAIQREGWHDWVELSEIHPNRGFAGGNNAVLRAVLERPDPPRNFLLLNADTLVRPAALAELLRAAKQFPDAGIISPRLEWPDGSPQQSCFRHSRPLDEMLAAARFGPLSRLLGRDGIALPVTDAPSWPEWTSFACALIRREVFEQVGVLDDGFYLYFDDPDFCRRARQAGWRVLHWPAARVVHLRGRSNPLKEMAAQRQRRPRYWYESRARYYAKHFGWFGLLRANLFWWLGRAVSLPRELLTRKPTHVCQREWLDIWIRWRDPLRPPETRQS